MLKIAPRIDDLADTLAKLCGYLPLALRLAGSALAERRTLTPADYVKRLEDAQTRLELVEASLSLSYDLLSEDLQQAWCALAVFPDTFDLAAAAAVWNVEKNLAQDQLDELVRYSLVEWNETAQRARLHDLARLFADKHLGDAARMDSQRRYATHYQRVSAIADGLYRQGGERLMQGLALFDLEWGNFQTGHAWAVQYADKDTQALGLCDDYSAQCPDILNLRLHPRGYVSWLETALIAARKLDRKVHIGWHLINLGVAYGFVGKYHLTIEYSEQALIIMRKIYAVSRGEAEQTESKRGEGAALGNLGNAYYYMGEYRRAIGYYQQHLTVAREIDDQHSEGNALGNLGNAYHALGEYRRASDYHEQSLTITRKIGDRRGEDTALGNLGNAYYSLKDYRRTRECYEQQRAIAREVGDHLGEAISLRGLALCLNAINDRSFSCHLCSGGARHLHSHRIASRTNDA